MPSYYKHNYAAFGAEVLRAGFMHAEMLARAERVKAAAEAIAPVGDPESGWYTGGREPGEYKASFRVSGGVTAYGGAGTRAFGRVTNVSDHAAAVEYGYGKTPKYRTLGKSMHAAGGDIKGGVD
jgi:hypothetical protein